MAAKLKNAAPLGRLGQPEEVAAAIIWYAQTRVPLFVMTRSRLLSYAASFTTGFAMALDVCKNTVLRRPLPHYNFFF